VVVVARLPRTGLSDGIYHVYCRGVASGPAFVDDLDRSRFVTLARLCEQRHEWVVHALTVLSTHYHVVVEATRLKLSAGLHWLNGRYAREFNIRHGRFGHVFAERFQTRTVDSEQYLYDVCAYVAQNPVAAGLCDAPEDWPWSYSRYPA
jgi:REP element-mobilizing transposase RayT